jgi:hypothetical protein
MKIYVFGNGNLSFKGFQENYISLISHRNLIHTAEFIIGDFRGVDTLMMEYLKTESANVTILHIGEKPRYLPDKYKTKVSSWHLIGNFIDDESRDLKAIEECTHYLAIDVNSNKKRISGTQKNIELCESLGKISIKKLLGENEKNG